jgi:hypothetical protein
MYKFYVGSMLKIECECLVMTLSSETTSISAAAHRSLNHPLYYVHVRGYGSK